jgi:hypothetical protein
MVRLTPTDEKGSLLSQNRETFEKEEVRIEYEISWIALLKGDNRFQKKRSSISNLMML